MRPYTEEPGAEQFACPVLDWRRMEQSIRRPYGKRRPLGLQTWSDKLLQEVIRSILDAFYEPQFSNHSHGSGLYGDAIPPLRKWHTPGRAVGGTSKATSPSALTNWTIRS